MKKKQILVSITVVLSLGSAVILGQQIAGITAKKGNAKAEFDIVQTNIARNKNHLEFSMKTSGKAGSVIPTTVGKLANSSVYSYVWPTSLDSSSVGFAANQGILALAATAHPDFDDTPRFDENGDGNPGNDGNFWHSHWVVLVLDDACGKGSLKVKDIPEGAKPTLPATWPNLPILIDSPGYEPQINGSTVKISIPLKDIGFPSTFKFDGVTAALRINADLHAPLLCVNDVFDVASGNLSLPGTLK